MRVQIVGINFAPEVSGIGPYTAGYAEHLDKKGHQVEVLTTFAHYPSWISSAPKRVLSRSEKLGRRSTVHRFRHYVPPSGGGVLRRSLSEAIFGVLAGSKMYRSKPDMVLLVSPALISSAVAMRVSQLFHRNVPVAVVVQDIYSKAVDEAGAGGSKLGALIAQLENWLLRSALGVSVIHSNFIDTLEAGGISRNNIAVNRNWSRQTKPESTGVTDDGSFRRSLNLTSSDFVVLHAGNIGKKQDLSSVVACARLAQISASSVKFIVLGDGSDRSRIEDLARGCQSISIVDPLGPSDFERALKSADVLLVNERAGMKEMAVPSKLTTYFRTMRPVVAACESESATAAEVLAAGAGCVVKPADPASLLQTLELLKNDPLGRSEFAKSAYAYANEVLSEDVILDKFVAWVEDLASVSSLKGGSK